MQGCVAVGCCCLFPGIFRLLSFAFVCSCVGLLRLLLGSEVTVVFVTVACYEPSDNNQMAHPQIVVVIALSLTFEMDVVVVVPHLFPFDCVGFH